MDNKKKKLYVVMPRHCGKSTLIMKKIFKLMGINLEDIIKENERKRN